MAKFNPVNGGKLWSTSCWRMSDSFDQKFLHFSNNEPNGDVNVTVGSLVNNEEIPETQFTISMEVLDQLAIQYLDYVWGERLDWTMRNCKPIDRNIRNILWANLSTTYSRTEGDPDEAQAQYEDWYYRRHPEKKKED